MAADASRKKQRTKAAVEATEKLQVSEEYDAFPSCSGVSPTKGSVVMQTNSGHNITPPLDRTQSVFLTQEYLDTYFADPDMVVEPEMVPDSGINLDPDMGKLSEFKGKSLDEIQVNPNEELVDEEGSDVSETEELPTTSQDSSGSRIRNPNSLEQTVGPDNEDPMGQQEVG
uniref:Uncharacterized protein n=1 Tax=Knipowitschia caucasica TaxID=637954 RepID=A0AAV2LI12_KNICA